MRKVRANVGVAYLWGNIASFMKQAQAIAYYLRDAGLVHLVSSVAERRLDTFKTQIMAYATIYRIENSRSGEKSCLCYWRMPILRPSNTFKVAP